MRLFDEINGIFERFNFGNEEIGLAGGLNLFLGLTVEATAGCEESWEEFSEESDDVLTNSRSSGETDGSTDVKLESGSIKGSRIILLDSRFNGGPLFSHLKYRNNGFKKL